jgi:hypothetical protein
VHLYKNDSNILWKHLVKFEMNSMSIKYSKTFLKQYYQCFDYSKDF